MGLAETAELRARLSMKDELSGTARRASSSFEKSMGKMASSARKGAGTAASNIGKIGLIAAAAVTGAVKSGVSSLATLEDATMSVDGAIQQVGKGWTLTGAQIAAIANDIETNVQRAFDDKEITQATETLIRYGGITQAQLRPAMEVMTDLAAKTGDVGSASSLLAKALAAPTKATRLLRQVGISLTKEQEDQIATWVDNGKQAKAQAFLLDLVARKTKGAAAAMHGPMNDAMNILKDVWEDATRALATGFLPVLEEVADFLSDELAKPDTLKKIKGLGDDLAGGFREAVAAARKVDWQSIGSSLKTAADGAKGILDAFLGAPEWVKTAVLTGWGLNKLTGGAVSEILGTGLEVGIKGIFGQFFARGASPANPLWVQSVAGGLGGAAGAAGGAAAGAGGIGLATLLGLPALAAAAVAAVAVDQHLNAEAQAGANVTGTRGVLATGNAQQISDALHGVEASVASLNPLQKILYDLNVKGIKTHTEGLAAALAGEMERFSHVNETGGPDDRQSEQRALDATTKLRTTFESKLNTVKTATDTSRIAQIAAQRTGDASIVAAIRSIQRPIVTVNVSQTMTRISYTTGTTMSRYAGKLIPES